MSTPQPSGEMSERLAPRAVSVEAAAKLLSVGRTTMFGLIRSGEVRTVTIGRRRLVPVSEVDAYVERLRGVGSRG
jgi:excisionase family DNA binding protein